MVFLCSLSSIKIKGICLYTMDPLIPLVGCLGRREFFFLIKLNKSQCRIQKDTCQPHSIIRHVCCGTLTGKKKNPVLFRAPGGAAAARAKQQSPCSRAEIAQLPLPGCEGT